MRLLNILILTLMIIVFSACDREAPSGRQFSERDDERVYQGITVPAIAAPAIVQLIISDVSNDSWSCSGTVIGVDSVLTAGHCFISGDHSIVSAYVRVLGLDVPIASVNIHPGYREEESLVAAFNDIAVVRTVVELGVAPMPLLGSQGVVSRQDLFVYGYGLDEHGQMGVLQGGVIKVDAITPNHIIDIVEDGYQNSCQGDSGGPLIATVVLPESGVLVGGVVGLVSTGMSPQCMGVGDTSLYVNLQNWDLLSFIVDQAPDAVVL